MRSKKLTPYPFYIKGKRNKQVFVKADNYQNAISKALALAPNKFLETKHAKNMDLVRASSKAKQASLRSAHKQYVVLIQRGKTAFADFDVETQFGLTSDMKIHEAYHKGVKLNAEQMTKELERVKQYITNNKPEKPEVMKKAISKIEKAVKAPKLSAAEMKVVKAEAAKLEKAMASTPEAKKEASKKAAKKEKEDAAKAKDAARAEKAAAKMEDQAKPTKTAKPVTKTVGKNKVIEGAKMVTISTAEMLVKIPKGFKYFTEEGKSKAESVLSARGDKEAKHKMQELKVK